MKEVLLKRSAYGGRRSKANEYRYGRLTGAYRCRMMCRAKDEGVPLKVGEGQRRSYEPGHEEIAAGSVYWKRCILYSTLS